MYEVLHNVRKLTFPIFLLIFSLLTLTAHAAQLEGVDTYPLSGLKPGIKATGYTVIRGTQIQTFDVEILELIPKGGFDGGPMILAKFTGPVVDHSKGIAGGYSGSPVYIGEKLVGAVSMAMPFTDTHIGGITPIESMLAALPEATEADYRNNTVLPPSSSAGLEIDENGTPLTPSSQPAQPVQAEPAAEPSTEGTQQASEQTSVVHMADPAKALAFNERMRELGLHKYAAVRATTPVLLSGFNADVVAEFGDDLAKKLGSNFTVESTGMGGAAAEGQPGLLLTKSKAQSATPPGLFFSNKEKAPPLKPGAAVTVSLMQGDIEMNAIGTLTYSDPSGRFLIFGHPMMGMGPTNMPLGEGYVTWTHTSIERAFKDGVRLNTLGTLTQDRGAACGGSFNQQADMVPVRVRVKDMDLNQERTLNFQVIRHPDYTPLLIAMGMAQASQQVLDRQLGGTMKMSYHLEGAGLKEPLRRTNYYSDDANVVFNGAFDIVPIANLLHTNIYRDVTLTKAEIMVEITRNRVNASIDDAKIVWDKDKNKASGSSAPPAINTETQVQLVEEDEESEVQDGQQPPQQQPGQPGQPGAATGNIVPPAGMLGIVPNIADMPTFAPGEEIKVRVRLQPYRTDPVWREFSIRVPDDFPSGNTMIMVHGGGDLISPSEVNGKGRNLFGMGPVIDVKEHDLDSILDQVTQWPLNNELLLTLVRPFDPTQPQELTTITPTNGATAPAAEKPADKVDAKYQMEWVIYNGFMLPVNIMTKADQETAAKAKAQLEEANKAAETKPAEDKPAEEAKPAENTTPGRRHYPGLD
jgi:hypothetical protein